MVKMLNMKILYLEVSIDMMTKVTHKI